MGNINEIFKKASDDYKNWYDKNKKLIETLGLSWNDAPQFRQQINEVQEDIKRFNKIVQRFVIYAIILLLLTSAINFLIKKDIIKLFYFIAYFLGLAGSFLASYGYLLQLKNIIPKRKNKRLNLPNIPQDFNEIPIYANRLNEFLANYINYQVDNNWPQIKIEIRKQKSLFWGFVIIAVSFLIQLILQFF